MKLVYLLLFTVISATGYAKQVNWQKVIDQQNFIGSRKVVWLNTGFTSKRETIRLKSPIRQVKIKRRLNPLAAILQGSRGRKIHLVADSEFVSCYLVIPRGWTLDNPSGRGLNRDPILIRCKKYNL